MILNMLEGKSLPVYGEGKNVRDWLYVEDHASAIWAVMRRAGAGETYNVGGETERRNIALVHRLCEIVAEETGVWPMLPRQSALFPHSCCGISDLVV